MKSSNFLPPPLHKIRIPNSMPPTERIIAFIIEMWKADRIVSTLEIIARVEKKPVDKILTGDITARQTQQITILTLTNVVVNWLRNEIIKKKLFSDNDAIGNNYLQNVYLVRCMLCSLCKELSYEIAVLVEANMSKMHS